MTKDENMTTKKIEATIIFDTHLPDALRRALEYAGDEGFVASMPQLLQARSQASFDNDIWNNCFVFFRIILWRTRYYDCKYK